MAENSSGTLILATDYRVPNPARVWPLLQRRRPELAGIGAHHVLLYESTWSPGRVLVTMAIHTPDTIVELLRSRVFFEWFDAVGVDDIPAVFAGRMVDKVEVHATDGSGVVVATLASVQDAAELMSRLHGATDRLATSGVRKMAIYQAFDDPREVMILTEMDGDHAARRWVAEPDAVAEWMHGAGVGPYPPPFVGKMTHAMHIDETR